MANLDWKRYTPVAVLIAIIAFGLFYFGPSEQTYSELSAPPASELGVNPGKTSDADLYGGSMTGLLVQFVLIFAGICGLAWLSLRWLLPKLYGSASVAGGEIKVVETFRLDSRRQLFLVEVRGESLLLSGSEQGVRLLTRVPPDSPVADMSEEISESSGPDTARDSSAFELALKQKGR